MAGKEKSRQRRNNAKQKKSTESKEKTARAVKRANRQKRAINENVVAIWNVRPMVEKGKNKIGHAESMLRSARDAGCETVGLQETRRTGQTFSQARG